MARDKVENVILWCIVGPVAAYLGYRWLKSAWDNPPPEESRNLIVDYDDDGNPIVDPFCDIDRTLDFWKEQNRLFRHA